MGVVKRGCSCVFLWWVWSHVGAGMGGCCHESDDWASVWSQVDVVVRGRGCKQMRS